MGSGRSIDHVIQRKVGDVAPFGKIQDGLIEVPLRIVSKPPDLKRWRHPLLQSDNLGFVVNRLVILPCIKPREAAI